MKGENIKPEGGIVDVPIIFEGDGLQLGQEFTIEGYGVSLHGKHVVNGKNPRTGRNLKAVRPMVFKVVKVL